MKETDQLAEYEVAHIDEALRWLQENLPCPPFTQKGFSRQAVCWFKDSAQGMILKFRDLTWILEQHGYPVQMLKTTRPGMILYEDEFQVLAESNA